MVAICGGGGKSTLATKWPDRFVDIDLIVWADDNKKWHPGIVKALKVRDFVAIEAIFDKIFAETPLVEPHRIILTHHPTQEERYGAEYVCVARPSRALHEANIAERTEEFKAISRNSWAKLSYIPGLVEYNSHAELEALMTALATKAR